MGLLDRIEAMDAGRDPPAAPGGVPDAARELVTGFARGSASFHVLILRRDCGDGGLSDAVTALAGAHGARCADLPGGECLVLLPGALDPDLFAHRICDSAGASAVFRFSSGSADEALGTLLFHLS